MAATGSAEYILAIDLGTGGPKVALISTDGEIAGYEFEPTRLIYTPDGGVEQDPDDWWQALSTAALSSSAPYMRSTLLTSAPPPILTQIQVDPLR